MDGEVIIGTGLDTKSFDAQISELEDKLEGLEEEYEAALKDVKFPEDELKKYASEIEKTKNKVISLKKKQDDLNKLNLSNISNSMNNIGNSVTKTITKVAKWGVALFGIRSIYSMLSSAASTLSSSNSQIGADIQYIKFALASTLQPVIERIIQLVYKLLSYIGYIAKAWFGVNLFANASAKAFNKVNKGIKGANKEAKKLEKTLAGFDEMNILQKDGSTSIGGGGGGIDTALPSMDLSQLDGEIPGWIKWIADNGNLIKDILLGIGAAIAGLKLAKLLLDLSGFGTSLKDIFTNLSKLTNLQLAGFITGIAVALAGVYQAVKGVISFIKDPSWNNFATILDGISKAAIGVGVALVSLNASNPFGWLSIGIGLTTKFVEVIGNLIDKNNDTVKSTMSVYDAEKKLNDARKNLTNTAKKYANAIKKEEQAEKQLVKVQEKYKISGKELHKEILNGEVTYKNLLPVEREVYDAYLNHIEAQEELNEVSKENKKAIDEERDSLKQMSASVYASRKVYDDYFQNILDGFNKSSKGFEDQEKLVNGTLEVMSKMDEKTREIFIKNLPSYVRDAFENVRKETAGTSDLIHVYANGVEISYKRVAGVTARELGKIASETNVASNTLSKQFGTTIPNNIQKTINKIKDLIKQIASLGTKGAVTMTIGSKIASGSRNAKGAVYYPPKLATGGIINQPGRGVPLAVGGERGAEGVVPLTDAQMMAQLGEAIGRNVVINTILNNYMNSRLISREIKTINNEDDFSFNR